MPGSARYLPGNGFRKRIKMQSFYPEYYKSFKCIANLCPDSCCQGWDVVVDEESELFYNSVKSEFGNKIRKVTVTDDDGDRVFTLKNGRCPFWNKDELCDIYINLGEDKLCKTCKKFPRITMEFRDFTEYTLSLACPEAAKLILSSDFTIPGGNYKLTGAPEDNKLTELLLNARNETFKIFLDKKTSFIKQLENAFLFNREIQNQLSPVSYHKSDDIVDLSFIFDIHTRLEFINSKYSVEIKSAASYDISNNHGSIFTRMALYYISRYYLNAYDSLDVLSVLKRILCAYVICASLAEAKSQENIIRIIQNYSKEVEHSYENMEILELFFENDERFSIDNLIKLIKKTAS